MGLFSSILRAAGSRLQRVRITHMQKITKNHAQNFLVNIWCGVIIIVIITKFLFGSLILMQRQAHNL